jgi:hypothetical protein
MLMSKGQYIMSSQSVSTHEIPNYYTEAVLQFYNKKNNKKPAQFHNDVIASCIHSPKSGYTELTAVPTQQKDC